MPRHLGLRSQRTLRIGAQTISRLNSSDVYRVCCNAFDDLNLFLQDVAATLLA
jgi:hypothetical protein